LWNFSQHESLKQAIDQAIKFIFGEHLQLISVQTFQNLGIEAYNTIFRGEKYIPKKLANKLRRKKLDQEIYWPFENVNEVLQDISASEWIFTKYQPESRRKKEK